MLDNIGFIIYLYQTLGMLLVKASLDAAIRETKQIIP